MTQITINTISGTSFPYQVFVCDVYGSNCIFIGTILGSVPPVATFILPAPFDIVPALSLKIIDVLGCEISSVIDCTTPNECCGCDVIMDAIITQEPDVYIQVGTDVYLKYVE